MRKNITVGSIRLQCKTPERYRKKTYEAQAAVCALILFKTALHLFT